MLSLHNRKLVKVKAMAQGIDETTQSPIEHDKRLKSKMCILYIYIVDFSTIV